MGCSEKSQSHRVAHGNTFDLSAVTILYPPGRGIEYEVWAGAEGIPRWTASTPTPPERLDRPELHQRVLGVAAEFTSPNYTALWFYGNDGFAYARSLWLAIGN